MPKETWVTGRGVRERRGFTLIELLVVVSVIGLLVGILMPSLLHARLLARRTACQGNLWALGRAALVYQMKWAGDVPVCWQNVDLQRPRPWKSWRTNLLAYTPRYNAFNCPGAADSGSLGAVFHSADEVRSQELMGTVNAGSYGVMYQYALPGYRVVNCAGLIARGHPMWSCAFSALPGASWTDPAASVYAADAAITREPVTYPTRGYKHYGTSVIMPPSAEEYFDSEVTRRFADRHCGTNCLFVDGHVTSYETAELDGMTAGAPDCVWDTQ